MHTHYTQTLRNVNAPSNDGGLLQASGTVFGIYCLLGNTAAMAAYIVTAKQLQPEYVAPSPMCIDTFRRLADISCIS